MLTIYETRSGALVPQKGQPRINEQVVWIDLINPTPEEEKKIERALKPRCADARRAAGNRGLEPALSGEAARIS